MFERYTENARRALFFARYEASECGQWEIRSEHLLVGLLRTAGVAPRMLADRRVSLADIQQDIEQRSAVREKAATPVEIPFSSETKRILQGAAQEADNLLHRHIGTEHLLLAMLRDEASDTTKMLTARGVRYAEVRDAVEKMPAGRSEFSHRTEVSALTAGLNQILDRLSTLASGKPEARSLVDQIRERLKDLERHFEQ